MQTATTTTTTRTSRPVAKTGSCECGCGSQTKAWFAPGHDARLHARAKKHQEGRLDLATLPQAEAKAVRDWLANEKLQVRVERTSFVVQPEKDPAIAEAARTASEKERLDAKIAKLQNLLFQAKAERKALGK